MVNVNREVTDQFYRYKMPKLLAKVEGKGNGIKTVIVNMTDIAKALGRPPTYPTKYFGCELGAQTQFDAKNDRYIVNGSHDSTRLQDLLDGFIRKFVLCNECDNPETQFNVLPKKGMIGSRCIACGHNDQIDMRHKLTTFILKNPPTGEDPGMTAATPQKGKKDRTSKGGKRGKDEPVTNGSASPEHTGNGDKNHTPLAADKKSGGGGADVDDEDVEWGEDVSDAAVAARRMQDLSGAVSSMVVTDDLEKTPQERVDIFYAFVKERQLSDRLSGVEAVKEVVGEAERLDIKEKAPLVLAELLFNADILVQLKLHRALLLRFTHEDQKAQKYLVGGLEALIGQDYPEALMPKVAHIFKALYDLDIVDEETLIDWSNKGPSKKYVKKEVSKEIHAKSAQFIDWLKQADEETESESEEEVEVVYSNTEKVGTAVVKANGATAPAEEEDDFDIDDI